MYAIRKRLIDSIFEVNELMMSDKISKKEYNQLGRLKKKLQSAYKDLLLVRIKES